LKIKKFISQSCRRWPYSLPLIPPVNRASTLQGGQHSRSLLSGFCFSMF